MMGMDIIIGGALAVALWAMAGLIRNDQVFRFRSDLLTDIGRAAHEDIRDGRPWEWRYDAFNHVEYHTMVLQFWRPLPSFYRSLDFAGRVRMSAPAPASPTSLDSGSSGGNS